MLENTFPHLPLSVAKTFTNELVTTRLDCYNILVHSIALKVSLCLAMGVIRSPSFTSNVLAFCPYQCMVSILRSVLLLFHVNIR